MKLSLGKTTWLLLQSFLQVKVAVKYLVGLNMLSLPPENCFVDENMLFLFYVFS